jgi:hypothetical protein
MRSYMLIQRKLTKYVWEEIGVYGGNIGIAAVI